MGSHAIIGIAPRRGRLAMLTLSSLSQKLWRSAGAAGYQSDHSRARYLWLDRSQRRGQDHGIQSDHRLIGADQRHHRVPRPTAKRIAPHRITRCGIARTFQNIRIFKEMTLIENVLVALGGRVATAPWACSGRRRVGGRRSGGKEPRREALLAKVGLADKAAIVAGNLSYGEQRRLEIARALATGAQTSAARRTGGRHEWRGKAAAHGRDRQAGSERLEHFDHRA